jgi:C-terminal processing protease CtpA/Prc/Tol biopolymer transport system component
MKTLFILLFSALLLFAGEAKFIRYPAPSPDGSTIAFSYQGDIWLVSANGGNATRLTVHAGYDFRPMWSPDGERIAFISVRSGNNNIFSMAKDGGDIRRHTVGNDYLFGWSADGESLYFASKRVNQYHWLPEIYSVDLNGGTPARYLEVAAIDGAESLDGNSLIYTVGYNHRWRKRYRGSANNNLFSYNKQTKAFTQLTDFDGNDLNPMPAENSLYYISEKSGFFNIHQMNADGSNDKQITTVTDDGVRYAQISRNGSTIVYTNNLDAYTLNTATGKSEKLSIFVPDDSPYDNEDRDNFSSGISEMELAPSDNEIAVVYHGEIYAYKPEEKSAGRMARITENAANDNGIIWSKDSKTIYFLSDRNGQYDVFMATPKDKGPFYLNKYFTITQLTKSTESEGNLQISPDGKYLSFQRGNGDLVRFELKTKTEKVLLTGWNLNGYSWSPDSKWIAYSRDDNNFNSDIFIMPAAGGSSVNISQHPDGDYSPTWSPDGRMLAFSSRRYADTYDVMYVFLTKGDDNKTEDDWKLEKEYKELAKKAKSKKKKKEDKIKIRIDFNDIHMRLRRLTTDSGNEFPAGFSSDGDDIFYTLSEDGETDLFKRNIWEKKADRITSGNTRPSSIRFNSKHKEIYYKSNSGSVHSIKLDGKGKKTYAYRSVFTQDKMAAHEQVFHEVWRVQNDHFYDPNFHGANWAQIRVDYLKKVQAVRSNNDFADVMNMMIGELNASHQRYSNPPTRGSEVYGNLGVDLIPVKNGVKITDIFPNSALTKSAIKAEIGDVITAVDGKPFTNFYETLQSTVGEQVDLQIQRKNKSFTIVARPQSMREVTGNLAYEKWTNENREKVHADSKGKLGYIHIRGMNIPSLEQFETELYSEAEGKEALVIDVRFNGGGWTTDFLLSILFTQEHAYTIPRNGGKGYPQGRRTFYHWTKPIVVLCNEFSYSNAEIFSHAIKNLKRGTLVGTPTFGAVISTGGQRLLNGGFIRMPFRGWYVSATGANQENIGAVPDIIVTPAQDERMNNRDSQLEKAIELFNTNQLK